MKNCKVTQYKKATNNDSLLAYGEVRIPVKNGASVSIALVSDSPSQVVRGLNGALINGESSVTLNAGWTDNIVISGVSEGSTGYISIPDKYKVLGFNGQNVAVIKGDLYNMFGLMSACQQFRPNVESEYSLSSLAKSFPVLTVVLFNSNLTGSIADLFPIKNTINTFDVPSGVNSKIEGTFDELGHFYKMNTYTTSHRLNLAGTVEGFVANRLIEQPATAGSVSIKWLGYNGRITYQGQAIESKESNTIAWDAQGNITLS